MIIIHGEDLAQSRKKLVEIIEQAKQKGVLVERVMGKQLDASLLESKLQKTDLFGHSRMLVVEELHSRPRSKALSQLIQMLSSSNLDICLWEKRDLTPTMLKKFPQAQVHHFKLANSLFSWLDSLSTQPMSKPNQLKLLKTALVENDEYLCFIMLARQVRLLIQSKQGMRIKGPSFINRKVAKQAAKFSQGELLWLHSQLYRLDQKLKSSGNKLALAQELEQIVIQL